MAVGQPLPGLASSPWDSVKLRAGRARRQTHSTRPEDSTNERGDIKSGGGGAALQDVPLVGKPNDSDASDLELSDEDLQFVEKHRRRLGFLEKLDQAELDKSIRAKQEKQVKDAEARKQAAAAAGGGSDDEDEEGEDDDGGSDGADEELDNEEEAAYERAPRRVQDDPRDKSAAGLPIKTLTGDVVYDKAAAAEGEDGGAAGRRKRAAAGVGGGSQKEAEMEAALAAAAAIQVEGVTITDDLEATLKESKKRAAEEAERRAKEEARKAAAAAKKAEEAALPPALRGLNLSSLEPSERRARLQEVMAAAAQRLLSAPEAPSSMGELRTLQALVADPDSMTSRLALLSLFAVFKDILPGYRIRPPSEKELEIKVSKEVAKLREYEQALLKSYQTYLRSLLDAANCVERGTGTLSHSRVAVRCLAGLLAAHPHFNYTSDILQAVVPRMASVDPETRSLACEAVRSLLEGGDAGDEGGAGRAALEAVQLIADMIRKRKCVAPPEVVRVLSVLRFRDVARPGRDDEEEEGGKRKKGRKAEKRDAKRRRKEDDVARSFKESSAGPDSEELARLQSSMLEALFEIYFRVLKHCCAIGLSALGGSQRQSAEDDGDDAGGGGGGGGPRVASASLAAPWSRARMLRRCPLLHPALDGLARYTHLISVDYMNDLLAVFSQLLAAPALPLPERLRLLATLAALLRGQGEALNVDRRDLYVQLYDTLLQVPLHSLLCDEAPPQRTSNGHPNGHNGQEEDDDGDVVMASSCDQAAEAAAAPPPPQAAAGADGPTRGSAAAATAPSVASLLAGVLEALLCEPKMADMQRAAAFVKRMAGAALMAGPGEAMALWAAIARLLRRYPKLANMLEYEGEAPTVGGRTYDPYCTDPSEAGALSTTLWEICLASVAQPHYHPHLAQAAGSIMALRPGAAAAAAASGGGGGGGAVHLTGPLGTPATITELAEAYDASRGLMRPPPPPPQTAAAGGRKGKAGRRGGGGAIAAAAAMPSEAFLENLEELAAEYGTVDGGWNDMEIEIESDLDVDDAHHDAAEHDADDADDGGGRPRSGHSGGGGAAGAGAGAVSASSAAAAAALRRMFLESQRFQRNKQLRMDKALVVEKLKRFHIHLQQRQVAAAAAAAVAAAAAPVAKTAAAAPAGAKAAAGPGTAAAPAAREKKAGGRPAPGPAPAAALPQQRQKGGKGQPGAAKEQQHERKREQQQQQPRKGGEVAKGKR